MTNEEIETRAQRAIDLFKQGYNCSQAVFTACADMYGITDESLALRLSASFRRCLFSYCRGIFCRLTSLSPFCLRFISLSGPEADSRQGGRAGEGVDPAEDEHRRAAQKAHLLANGAEDEVGLNDGNETGQALADARAHEVAVGQRIQRLDDLQT